MSRLHHKLCEAGTWHGPPAWAVLRLLCSACSKHTTLYVYCGVKGLPSEPSGDAPGLPPPALILWSLWTVSKQTEGHDLEYNCAVMFNVQVMKPAGGARAGVDTAVVAIGVCYKLKIVAALLLKNVNGSSIIKHTLFQAGVHMPGPKGAMQYNDNVLAF